MKQVHKFNITDLFAMYTNRRQDSDETINVPCGSCRACCYNMKVAVDPAQERPEDLQLMGLQEDDGELIIPKRADGGCIHLAETGCGIYEHRPLKCRTFDCRPLSLINVYRTDLEQPDWQMVPGSTGGLFLRLMGFVLSRWMLDYDVVPYIEVMVQKSVGGALTALPYIMAVFNALDQNTQRSVLASHMKIFRELERKNRIRGRTGNNNISIHIDEVFNFLTREDRKEIYHAINRFEHRYNETNQIIVETAE